MEVNNDVGIPEGEELAVSTVDKLMNSFVNLSPTALIKMAHHMRLLHGRVFFLSLCAGQHSDETVPDDLLKTDVRVYHSYVNAHLIKQSLQMHPFYSSYLAPFLERENHKIEQRLESVFTKADKLVEAVGGQKDLSGECLALNLSSPKFYRQSIAKIDDHRSSLEEQKIDKTANMSVVQKKSEVRFLAEISHRLLSTIHLDNPDLVDVLIYVTEVLDQIQ